MRDIHVVKSMLPLPRVNPVGVLETPDHYKQSPRRYSAAVRVFAGALLLCFVTAVLWTGASSLAQVCLTTYAGLPFPYPR